MTSNVLQLLNGTNGVPGLDVELVTVAEVHQDVFGVKSRGRVVNKLGEAKRANGRDFKPAALVKQTERKQRENKEFFVFFPRLSRL